MAEIISYGAYVPRLRIKVDQIAKIWDKDPENIKRGLKIREKSVPEESEDTSTIAVEIARNILKRADIDPDKIGAIYVGSESHPYAVNPTSSTVAKSIRASPNLTAADLEFACKAGTAGIQMCMGGVDSGMFDYGISIGADTAQSKPGDALEYSAGAGGAGYLIGSDGSDGIANIRQTVSMTTDTPDFWRREGTSFPEHGGRFTGKPGYYKHVIGATNMLLDKAGTSIEDYDYFVFHQPNGKFPRRAAKKLGIPLAKLKPSLLVDKIGNTYSGATMLGLASVLDHARPGDRILTTSYGSGAGSDSFDIEVKEGIKQVRDKGPSVASFLEEKKYLTYGQYAKIREKLIN